MALPNLRKPKPLGFGPRKSGDITEKVQDPDHKDELQAVPDREPEPLPEEKPKPEVKQKPGRAHKERATFYMDVSYLENLERDAYWNREDSMADIIQRALDQYWKGKTFDPVPEGKRKKKRG